MATKWSQPQAVLLGDGKPAPKGTTIKLINPSTGEVIPTKDMSGAAWDVRLVADGIVQGWQTDADLTWAYADVNGTRTVVLSDFLFDGLGPALKRIDTASINAAQAMQDAATALASARAGMDLSKLRAAAPLTRTANADGSLTFGIDVSQLGGSGGGTVPGGVGLFPRVIRQNTDGSWPAWTDTLGVWTLLVQADPSKPATLPSWFDAAKMSLLATAAGVPATPPAPGGGGSTTTPTLTATATATGSDATLLWESNQVPAGGWRVGRDGTDATGFGAWSGSITDGTARTFRFTQLAAGAKYNLTVECDLPAGGKLSKTVSITMSGSPSTPTTPGTPTTPLTGTAISRLGIQSRTGLPWLSGWFTEHSQTLKDEFGVMNGSGRMDAIVGFSPTDSAADYFGGPEWATGSYCQGFQGYFVWEMAPMLGGGANNADKWTWDDVANGRLDTHCDNVVAGLTKYGFGERAIIRFAEEANGEWYPWCINAGNLAAFKAGFRRVSQRIHSKAPKIMMGYELVAGRMIRDVPGAPIDMLRKAYPGDDVVDVILMDTYDWPPLGITSAAGAAAALRPAGVLGVGHAADFARERGKPYGIPEWGVSRSGYVAGANGDNPVFIEEMYKFFQSTKDVLLFESYWNNHDSRNTAGAIWGPTLMPLAAAKYQQLWSQR